MSVSTLMIALMIMGIVIFYAIAIILIVNFIGKKLFKDKTNMIFVYASIILVIQTYDIFKGLLNNQGIDSFNILFLCIGLAWIFQGIRKKRLNHK